MRARNLKPGFFKNDLLAECEPLARLLFQGLWCMADRDGRLELRPKRLKAEILPYDNVDILKLLNQLIDKGFVVAYKYENDFFLSIPTFTQHQNPHIKEAASIIPAPDESDTCLVLKLLNPESLLLNPSSLNPVHGLHRNKPVPVTQPFHPPTIEQVIDFCKERKNRVDPEKWFHHYESNGWLVGKNKMKSWKSAIITWEKSQIDNNGKKERTLEPWEELIKDIPGVRL
jgi:hypothetical protein